MEPSFSFGPVAADDLDEEIVELLDEDFGNQLSPLRNDLLAENRVEPGSKHQWVDLGKGKNVVETSDVAEDPVTSVQTREKFAGNAVQAPFWHPVSCKFNGMDITVDDSDVNDGGVVGGANHSGIAPYDYELLEKSDPWTLNNDFDTALYTTKTLGYGVNRRYSHPQIKVKSLREEHNSSREEHDAVRAEIVKSRYGDSKSDDGIVGSGRF